MSDPEALLRTGIAKARLSLAPLGLLWARDSLLRDAVSGNVRAGMEERSSTAGSPDPERAPGRAPLPPVPGRLYPLTRSENFGTSPVASNAVMGREVVRGRGS